MITRQEVLYLVNMMFTANELLEKTQKKLRYSIEYNGKTDVLNAILWDDGFHIYMTLFDYEPIKEQIEKTIKNCKEMLNG